MKKTTALLAGLALLPGTASAEFLGLTAAGPGLFVSDDNEGFSVNRYSLYALPVYRNGNDLTGAKITYHRYAQNDWRQFGEQISLIHRNGHPAAPENWQLETGYFRQGGHEFISLDGSYSRSIADRTRVELFASRDWVETAPALQRGVYFSFLGAALEQGLGDHFSLIGVGGSQIFSDSNHRTHLRLRAVYQPILDIGFTLQARQNFYHSSSDDVDRLYFNPDNYRRTLFGFGYRQRVQGWIGALTVATGPQKIDDEDSQRAHLLELSMESPASYGPSIKVRGGYSRAAGFIGPNYEYRYLQAEWLLPF